jgi:hypothetical protein
MEMECFLMDCVNRASNEFCFFVKDDEIIDRF